MMVFPGTIASNRGEFDCHVAVASTTAKRFSPPDETLHNQEKLIMDVTMTEQTIRFPTDFGLLNEARELSKRIIDAWSPATEKEAAHLLEDSRKGLPPLGPC